MIVLVIQMSKVKSAGKELYFSSSEEEGRAPQRESLRSQNKEVRFEENINELSGLEVFQIFCDYDQLKKILSSEDADKGVLPRFYWRVMYIIGEIVLQVQQFLLGQQRLNHCLLLRHDQIFRIASKMIKIAEKDTTDPQFLKVKDNMQMVYKHSVFDSNLLVSLYNYFVKLAEEELSFEMVLKFDRKNSKNIMEQELQSEKRIPVELNRQTRRKNPEYQSNYGSVVNSQANMTMSSAENPRIGNYTVTRMTQEKQGPMSSIQKSTASSSFNGLRGTINGQSPEAEILKTPPPPENSIPKGYNSKWSSTEQAIFCKIYSEHDSPVACAQLMQKEIGPDGRWKSPNQIELKMYSLVQKVFKKFATLPTNNEYIKKFREQKELVLNMPDPLMKKKIFRNIAIIYESMLNVSEQKKAVISHKILQVNRLCKDANLMYK